MAEIDTSFYPKPAALPVQKSALDQMQQYQQLESGAQTIQTQKLQNANTALTYLTRAMGSIGPTDDKSKYAAVGENAVKMGLVPPQALGSFMERLQAAPDGKTFYKEVMTAAADHQQQLNMHLGINENQTDNANIYQGKRDIMNGGFIPATQLAIQVPPGTPVVNNQRLLPNGQPNPNYLQPQLVGPSGPPGVAPVPTPQPRPQMPVAAVPGGPAPTTGPVGPTANNGSEFNNRFNASYATGAPPGVAGAISAVKEQSGKDYAADLARAKNYQQDLYPSQRVLDIVKEEGSNAFGPGTEGLNALKSALVTWLPNVDQKLIDGVSNYEQAKKYLVQAARSSGTTGTNDQLAAAFEANPNVKMSGATIENVVKSNIALRKMQHAQTLLFGQQGLPESEYSQWIAQNQNILDPRAFGFDMMNNEAKVKMLEGMATKDKSGNWIAKKGKEKEFKKFETSLGFANDAGLIEPPGRR